MHRPLQYESKTWTRDRIMSITKSVTESVTESTDSDSEIEYDTECDMECDTECDTECKEWAELEIQIQQMIQTHEEAITSLERIQEALSTEIQMKQDGVSRSLEEVLDELSEQSVTAQVVPFWLQVQKVIENADLI